MSKEAMRLALTALDAAGPSLAMPRWQALEAMGALTAALALPDAQPVGTFYVTEFRGLKNDYFEESGNLPPGEYKLYVAPQPAIAPEPVKLTDAEIIALSQQYPCRENDWADAIDFARALESAIHAKQRSKS